jgi:cytochrome c553
MHPVGAGWVEAHQDQAEGHLSSCAPCHGADFRGTALSRMFATRTLAGRTLAAGTVVGCYTCHDGPNGD